MKKIPSRLAAFTLIELMITTSITAIMLITVTSLFMSFLNSAYKSRISRELRETGNLAMNSMIQQIRAANEISTSCSSITTTNSLSVIAQDGLTSTFSEIEDKIASSSAQNGNFYLTTSRTGVDRLKNLEFTCYPGVDGTPRYIELSFTLQSGNQATRSISSSVIDFSSGVTIRN